MIGDDKKNSGLSTPSGAGMKLGQSFRFVSDEDMPSLDAQSVAQACDELVQGVNCYSSLLYLSRARLKDIPSLFEASRSNDVQVRWQRLWVLCPILARLARAADGRTDVIEHVATDLPALHMFAKFDPKNNPGPKRFFERLQNDLTNKLLDVIVEHRNDEARRQLLSGILSVVETSKFILEQKLVERHNPSIAQDILRILVTEDTSSETKRLSTEDLRHKLETLGT
jgi:hypothetical protein|tara:strand:+ start:195 stop:872 length:678 start_codon:yes stop_codon:yes gene_type:complete